MSKLVYIKDLIELDEAQGKIVALFANCYCSPGPWVEDNQAGSLGVDFFLKAAIKYIKKSGVITERDVIINGVIDELNLALI